MGNIHSNKIASISRFEPKDFADIWTISKYQDFEWEEIIYESKTKEAGVDPIEIFRIINSIPSEVFTRTLWCEDMDIDSIINDLHIVAKDILEGKNNTLHLI